PHPTPPGFDMTTTFARATTVTPRGPGRYGVDLAREYSIMGAKPNGGYILACLARATLHAAHEAGASQRQIIAATTQYLSSPDLGPAEITTAVDRIGRSASQVTATIGTDGAVGVRAQFTLGTLHEASTPYWGAVPPVAMPPIEQCELLQMADGREEQVLFDPATTFRVTSDGLVVTGDGEFRAWFRDDGAGMFDSVGLMYASDVLPPATFGVLNTGWVPTLSLTVYNRAIPAPGPLQLRFRVQVIQDGYADEALDAWDSTGRLVMQATQLAALRLPQA
ncbi:MAG TPA: thioesterase family protein, partial [Ilumatobacteraceae bacterium]|nr:thioesterase family protein [Ilumatobacteraceae bacterium]